MRLLPRLIDHVHSLGFEIRGGALLRDSRFHGAVGKNDVIKELIATGIVSKKWFEDRGYASFGHIKSGHKNKLAIDLNLTKDGVYLEGSIAETAHGLIHNWWDTMGGAKRIPDDLNHYSIEYEGMR